MLCAHEDAGSQTREEVEQQVKLVLPCVDEAAKQRQDLQQLQAQIDQLAVACTSAEQFAEKLLTTQGELHHRICGIAEQEDEAAAARQQWQHQQEERLESLKRQVHECTATEAKVQELQFFVGELAGKQNSLVRLDQEILEWKAAMSSRQVEEEELPMADCVRVLLESVASAKQQSEDVKVSQEQLDEKHRALETALETGLSHLTSNCQTLECTMQEQDERLQSMEGNIAICKAAAAKSEELHIPFGERAEQQPSLAHPLQHQYERLDKEILEWKAAMSSRQVEEEELPMADCVRVLLESVASAKQQAEDVKVLQEQLDEKHKALETALETGLSHATSNCQTLECTMQEQDERLQSMEGSIAICKAAAAKSEELHVQLCERAEQQPSLAHPLQHQYERLDKEILEWKAAMSSRQVEEEELPMADCVRVLLDSIATAKQRAEDAKVSQDQLSQNLQEQDERLQSLGSKVSESKVSDTKVHELQLLLDEVAGKLPRLEQVEQQVKLVLPCVDEAAKQRQDLQQLQAQIDQLAVACTSAEQFAEKLLTTQGELHHRICGIAEQEDEAAAARQQWQHQQEERLESLKRQVHECTATEAKVQELQFFVGELAGKQNSLLRLDKEILEWKAAMSSRQVEEEELPMADCVRVLLESVASAKQQSEDVKVSQEQLDEKHKALETALETGLSHANSNCQTLGCTVQEQDERLQSLEGSITACKATAAKVQELQFFTGELAVKQQSFAQPLEESQSRCERLGKEILAWKIAMSGRQAEEEELPMADCARLLLESIATATQRAEDVKVSQDQLSQNLQEQDERLQSLESKVSESKASDTKVHELQLLLDEVAGKLPRLEQVEQQVKLVLPCVDEAAKQRQDLQQLQAQIDQLAVACTSAEQFAEKLLTTQGELHHRICGIAEQEDEAAAARQQWQHQQEERLESLKRQVHECTATEAKVQELQFFVGELAGKQNSLLRLDKEILEWKAAMSSRQVEEEELPMADCVRVLLESVASAKQQAEDVKASQEQLDEKHKALETALETGLSHASSNCQTLGCTVQEQDERLQSLEGSITACKATAAKVQELQFFTGELAVKQQSFAQPLEESQSRCERLGKEILAWKIAMSGRQAEEEELPMADCARLLLESIATATQRAEDVKVSQDRRTLNIKRDLCVRRSQALL